MFVIADNNTITNRFNIYFKNSIGKCNIISINLSDAKKFNSRGDAIKFLSEIPPDDIFHFKVFELTIKI